MNFWLNTNQKYAKTQVHIEQRSLYVNV